MSILWKTELRKVSDLKAYEHNPRNITPEMFAKLKDSIDKMGYVELVAIDIDNIIVAGHMRVRALIDLGRGEEMIEVRVPERKLTSAEFRKYLIQSNRVIGQWDYNTLGNVFDVPELIDYGFTHNELGMNNEGDKNAVDKDNLSNTMDSYLEGNIKQIVLYFKDTEYQNILDRMEALVKSHNLPNYTDVFKMLLTHHENTGTQK